MNNQLPVSEVFTSIQGEGKSAGVPSIFLRLGGCNLMCGGIGTQNDKQLYNGAKWRCDTIEVWTKFLAKDFDKILTPLQEQQLCEGYHLIVTGGEPLLQQTKIINFVKYFIEKHGKKPFIEIETNGTIPPLPAFIEVIDQWNCSPKLANSGNTKERRYRPEVIKKLATMKDIQFKYVINAKEDWKEVEEDYLSLHGKELMTLMPSGENQDLLEESRRHVAELCIEKGIRYTDRHHIVIWNKKTGV